VPNVSKCRFNFDQCLAEFLLILLVPLIVGVVFIVLVFVFVVASGKWQAASGERACHQFDDLKIAP